MLLQLSCSNTCQNMNAVCNRQLVFWFFYKTEILWISPNAGNNLINACLLLSTPVIFCVVTQITIFMPQGGGIMFSGRPSVRPSVRPKPEIPSFYLYMGLLVHPTNRDRLTACPSVRPSVRPSVQRGFRAFVGERMEGTAWNFACWCIVTTFRTD